MTHIRHISHIHHINRAACHPIPPIVPIVPTHTSRALRTRPTYPLRAPQRTKKHFQSAPRGYSLTFRLQKFAILLIQCLLSVLTVPQFCKVVSSFGGGEGVFLGYFQKKAWVPIPPTRGCKLLKCIPKPFNNASPNHPRRGDKTHPQTHPQMHPQTSFVSTIELQIKGAALAPSWNIFRQFVATGR